MTAPARTAAVAAPVPWRAVSSASFFILALVLWSAAYAKSFAFDQFREVLVFSGLVPAALATPAALTVLALEYGLPVALALPRTRMLGLVAIIALLLGFCIYNLWRIAAHVGVPCVCFAGLFTLEPGAMFLIDLLLLALCGFLIGAERQAGGCRWESAAARLTRRWTGALPAGPWARAYTGTCVALSAVFFALTGAKLIVYAAARSNVPLPPRPVRTLPAAAATLTAGGGAVLGAENAPYTLVEFGDYQCPPCRAQFRSVEALAARHHGRVRVVFRHLPLVDIHPFAFRAALAAETARRHGSFAEMHRRLMAGRVDESGIDAAADGLGLRAAVADPDEEERSRQAVRRDQSAAAALGLSGTPSFLLRRPDGRTLLLPDLAAAERELSQAGGA